METTDIIPSLKTKMQKAIESLDHDLKGLRTGRASAALLDPVVVEAYGDKVPLSQVGTVSAPDPKMISVQVWDKDLVKAVEKAITNANLGVNPVSDAQLVRISIPPLSEERRKELSKVASKYGENSKVAIRNIRRDALEQIKKKEKSTEISKDEMHKLSDQIQTITDDHSKKIDSTIETKSKDILQV